MNFADKKSNKIKKKQYKAKVKGYAKLVTETDDSQDESLQDNVSRIDYPDSPRNHTQNVTSANFDEDGDVIQMEINDGGAAEAEFASDRLDRSEDSAESDQETDKYSDEESEEGELTDRTDNEDGTAVANTSCYDPVSPPAKKAKKSKHESWRSVKDRLDNLSDTLKIMKDFMLQKGMMNHDSEAAGSESQNQQQQTRVRSVVTKDMGKDRAGKVNSNTSSSETTIYQKALRKEGEGQDIIVDNEISFKKVGMPEVDTSNAMLDKSKLSPSSDEQIDTSDEMMDVEIDINDRFIADCAEEARRWSAGEAQQSTTDLEQRRWEEARQ